MKISLLSVLSSMVFALSAVPAWAAPTLVNIQIPHAPVGSIVIRESEKQLYFKLNEQQALRYRVATPNLECVGLDEPTWSANIVARIGRPRKWSSARILICPI